MGGIPNTNRFQKTAYKPNEWHMYSEQIKNRNILEACGCQSGHSKQLKRRFAVALGKGNASSGSGVRGKNSRQSRNVNEANTQLGQWLNKSMNMTDILVLRSLHCVP